jgi:hypothetical protein
MKKNIFFKIFSFNKQLNFKTIYFSRIFLLFFIKEIKKKIKVKKHHKKNHKKVLIMTRHEFFLVFGFLLKK